MQRNHYKKTVINLFFGQNEIGAARKFFISNFFFNFNYFHVFLVKVLNKISANQNKIIHIFYKEKFLKLNYIHLKLFFGGLVQTLQFFLVK